MASALELHDVRFRGDLHWAPDRDGVTRAMVWDAAWTTWDVPQPRVQRLGNPTALAVNGLLDHLAAHRDALDEILRTAGALAEVLVYYARVRELESVLPPATLARLAALGLTWRVSVLG